MPGLEAPWSSSETRRNTLRTSSGSRYSTSSSTDALESITMESEEEAGDCNDLKARDVNRQENGLLPEHGLLDSDLIKSADSKKEIDDESVKANKSDSDSEVADDVTRMENIAVPDTGCYVNSIEGYTGNGSLVSNEDNFAVVGCDIPNKNTNKHNNNQTENNVTPDDSVSSSDQGTCGQMSTCFSNEDNCRSDLMPNVIDISEPSELNIDSLITNPCDSKDVKCIEQSKSSEGGSSDPVNSVPAVGELLYDMKEEKCISGNGVLVHPETHAPADHNVQTNTTCKTEQIKQATDGDKSDSESELDEFEEELSNERYNEISDYIPKAVWKTPLKCLSYSTVTDISYRLDPPTDAIEPAPYCKDFTGLCDRLKLDPAFTKYLVKSNIRLKTEEVLSKWEVLKPGQGPRPTIGNFAKIVYYDLERPDVIYDLQDKIVQDAENFEKTKKEAVTDKQCDEDRSWELTRHDVAKGEETHYTCCLCYADEDEGMATLITNFFQTVCGDKARFFRPQFDLKMGRYTYDTLAKVIEERCNGKVIFLLSDYFYANPICQFAVNFAHSRNPAAEQGNLIPFYLTNKYETAPKVLKGIAGVRWARKQFRYHSWELLSDCLMARLDGLSKIQERIKVELASSPSEWLCDPPYDEGTPEPGPALPLNEPPDDPVNSSSTFDPDAVDESQLVNSDAGSSAKWYRRLVIRVRNVFSGFRSSRQNRAPRRSIRPEVLNQAFVEDRDPPHLV